MTETPKFDTEKLKKSIKLDGKLSLDEKESIKEALNQDTDGIIEQTKTLLKDFITKEFSTASYDRVGKSGVKKVQEALGISSDGIYWPDTFAKVVKFQKENGLKVDGIIGQETLNATQTKKVPTIWNKERKDAEEYWFDIKEAIAKFEKRFPKEKRESLAKVLNIESNSSTEAFVKAVAKFQKVRGNLTIDGIPGKETLKALNISTKEDIHTPMTGEEIGRKNAILKEGENAEIREKLSERWKVIFDEFSLHLSAQERNEMLTGKYPIALTDSRTKKCILVMGKETKEFPVIFGSGIVRDKNWNIIATYPPVRNGKHSWDHATMADVVYRFNGSYIAEEKYGRAAANRGEKGNKTILGARIESPESAANGEKWWHGVADYRIPGWATWWCVGMKVQDARYLAQCVEKTGKWYWYVSKVS